MRRIIAWLLTGKINIISFAFWRSTSLLLEDMGN
jgi:hypothetical protein